jgi:hypothetical protein
LGCAVIRIRYRAANELAPGLHAAAERHGRNTTVYLLSGLTTAERRAALRRLRISARVGRNPRLPAAQLRLALLADRIRTSLGWAGAVFRSHPAGSTVPVMVISAGAVAFLALSAVSIQVIHTPRAPGQPLAAGLPAASGTIPVGGGSTDPTAGGGVIPGGAGAASSLVTPGQAGPGAASGGGVPPGQPGATGAAGAAGGSGTGTDGGSGAGTLTGNADPTPSPAADGGSTAPASSASSAAAATSAPAAQPSPTPSASSNGACLHLGPLGVCL